MTWVRYPSGITLQRIAQIRNDDVREFDALKRNKLPGRHQTGVRAVPSAATDVTASDLIGDWLTDGTYKYELVNVVGTGLRWHRTSLSVGW